MEEFRLCAKAPELSIDKYVQTVTLRKLVTIIWTLPFDLPLPKNVNCPRIVKRWQPIQDLYIQAMVTFTAIVLRGSA